MKSWQETCNDEKRIFLRVLQRYIRLVLMIRMTEVGGGFFLANTAHEEQGEDRNDASKNGVGDTKKPPPRSHGKPNDSEDKETSGGFIPSARNEHTDEGPATARKEQQDPRVGEPAVGGTEDNSEEEDIDWEDHIFAARRRE
jgi:hypothetical protein